MQAAGPKLFERPRRRMRGQRKRIRSYRPAPWINVPESLKKNKLENGLVVLLATLAFHAMILLVIPKVWIMAEKQPQQKTPDTIEWVKLPPAEEKFVEANPNVKKEEKDPNTPSFSSQAQVAAQEKPVEGAQGEQAHIDGEQQAHKITQGSTQRAAQQAQPAAPAQEQSSPRDPTPPIPAEPEAQQQSEQEDIQAKKLQITPEGTAPIQKEPVDTPKPIAQKQPAAQQKPVRAARASPRPRPQLTAATSAVTGPLKAYEGNAGRAGLSAVDARFSQYGEYLQRMLEAISSQWTMLAQQAGPSQLNSGFVDLAFDIDYKGQVAGIQVRSTSLGSVEVMICQDAIQSRAPFGLWSEDMIKTLGGKQTIRIKFFYM